MQANHRVTFHSYTRRSAYYHCDAQLIQYVSAECESGEMSRVNRINHGTKGSHFFKKIRKIATGIHFSFEVCVP